MQRVIAPQLYTLGLDETGRYSIMTPKPTHEILLYKHSNPTTEAYGFSLAMVASVVWVLWVLWAILPEWLLISLGIRWFPNRYVGVAYHEVTGLIYYLHGVSCYFCLFMWVLSLGTCFRRHLWMRWSSWSVRNTLLTSRPACCVIYTSIDGRGGASFAAAYNSRHHGYAWASE